MWDGKRRFGKPRTDAERKARHKKLYGTSKLPKRGTGIMKQKAYKKMLEKRKKKG